MGNPGQPVPQGQGVPVAPVQGNYQPASVTISGGSGHSVFVGQEGPNFQQSWTQRLANHTMKYWCSHFALALLAIILWELAVWVYHAAAMPAHP